MRIKTNGKVSELLRDVPIPKMFHAVQEFDTTPVSPAKEREINELNADTQSAPAAKTDEKLSEAELVEIRAKAQSFMKGNAANKDKVKAWLNKNGLARVTEMPKSAVPSFLALIGGGNS